jgi:hypothetical protein
MIQPGHWDMLTFRVQLLDDNSPPKKGQSTAETKNAPRFNQRTHFYEMNS